jgi:mono/diheme cytochrome c family protein
MMKVLSLTARERLTLVRTRAVRRACFRYAVLFALVTPPAFCLADSPPLPADHAEKMARGRELFTRQVRPLLLDSCFKCHGGEKTRSGLDLTTRDSLLKGGDNGQVVGARGETSKLYRLAAHLDNPHMPPKTPRLADDKIKALADWIDLGAPYDKPLAEKGAAKKPMVVTDEDRRFWSFRPLVQQPLPAVKQQAKVRTPIDRFILGKLEEKGISFNEPIDRRRLIRRATFDLTGLPPTPEEVDAFVKDGDPGAYDKLLDRLLASTAYGERWARHWLDLARFAESHGFEHDYDRPSAYHYRDFVIKALNQDMPYDRFVSLQLAGDELEPDNPLALMATGFLAAGVHSTQITANQVEKERYDELDDILRTTGTAMLGLTIGCARCHDHKYDPIPTRDYYRMLTTFTTTVRSEKQIELDANAPAIAKAEFDRELRKRSDALATYERDELPRKFAHWLSEAHSADAPRWQVLDINEYKSAGGASLSRQADGSILASGANPDHDKYTFVARTQAQGITAIRVEALAHPSFVKNGPGRAPNGNFALSDFRVTAAPIQGGKSVTVNLVNARATFEQKGLAVASAIDRDKLSAWAVDPQFGKDHAAAFETETDIGFPGGTILTFTLEFNNNTHHSIGRPRLSFSTATRPASLDGNAMPAELTAILSAVSSGTKPNTDQTAKLMSWFRVNDPEWRKVSDRVEELRKAGPRKTSTAVLISSEGVPAVRLHTQGADFLENTHFLKRGDPNQKDGVAQQGFLHVLMRKPEEQSRWMEKPPSGWHTSYRRRAFAAWMTDTQDGAGALLARVIVNRLWQHHFGRGLVATPSDFGYQGERPTHPELLDWLAGELIAKGWHLKAIHKLIMQSAVYTQGIEHDPGRVQIDPENRLLWRHVPQRLEAEEIRDAMLEVSRMLDNRMFGPGSLDRNMKRRSIYFTVKRSQLIPSMVLFDGPDGLQGVEQRSTTTVAPQALLLMNNAAVRDCAAGFGRRILLKDKPIREVVRDGYRTALGREPTAIELSESEKFVEEQTAAYRADSKVAPTELAVTDFCQVLLGLNEFLYVD